MILDPRIMYLQSCTNAIYLIFAVGRASLFERLIYFQFPPRFDLITPHSSFIHFLTPLHHIFQIHSRAYGRRVLLYSCRPLHQLAYSKLSVHLILKYLNTLHLLDIEHIRILQPNDTVCAGDYRTTRPSPVLCMKMNAWSKTWIVT